MLTNKQKLEKMLDEVTVAVVPFVEDALESSFGQSWRDRARLPKSLSYRADLDAYASLYAIIHNWIDVFQRQLKPAARDAASATLAGRNALSHASGGIDEKITLRALSGGFELLQEIGASNEAAKAKALYEEMLGEQANKLGVAAAKSAEPKASKPTLTLRQQSAEAPKPVQEEFFAGGEVEGLTPWHKIMPPRPDVLSGRLNKDSFAANLAVADRDYRAGKESTESDPITFFESTHLTRGLSLVLEQAGRRFIGGDAPSTIGLQTNFGGGKTHTLLSLLHMARLGDLDRVDVLKPVSDAINLHKLPEMQTAVFSGVDKGPDQPLDRADSQNIRTLWGYLAWHLAGREGLQLVAGSEEAGTNPGAQVLQQLLELTGKPSLILLDELVVFIRQLSGERFEAYLSFLQSLTEAAAQVPNALIVGSLPESEIEAGQDQGREALRRLEKLFGRVQSAWEPAQGSETYAVIRRRLFQDIDEAGERERKKTVDRFRKLYRDNKGDFPAGVDLPDYGEQMLDAYPVHPMLFDILSADWGPLEKFQRTRGVLALLARALFASYHSGSTEPLILPSSIRLSDPAVKGAITEPLEGSAWSSIIDSEVDGDRSLAWEMENRRTRYGKEKVARRAARAVFLSTAPGEGSKSGMTGQELRLACATPGEQISIFGDALRELSERSAHLYSGENRYWYGAKPTLNKVAQQREGDISDADADAKIVEVLRLDERPRGGWGRVHIAPSRALEVADERTSQLVILGPDFSHEAEDSVAVSEALDGVERRAGGQRINRNSLVFLAAEAKSVAECRRLAKSAKAWLSILSDKNLDLTESQRAGAEASVETAREALLKGVRKAWIQLLVPIPDTADTSKILIDVIARRQEGGKTPAEHAWQIAKQEGAVIETLGRDTLSERVLNLWPDSAETLPVDKIRDWYFEFPYMERVRDESVVADAISQAVAVLDDPPFAHAEGQDDDHLMQLSLSKSIRITFGTGGLLVLPDVARDFLTKIDEIEPPTDGPTDTPGEQGDEPTSPSTQKHRRFSAITKVDPSRGALVVNQIFENIISELERDPDATIEVTLEINAESPGGFAEDVEEIVQDNAQTMGFDAAKFSA